MADSPGETRTWRVIDLLRWGENYFRDHYDDPRRQIEWLLCSLLNCNRMDLYLRFEEPLSRALLAQLRGWVKRRTAGEPLQYITGKTEFYSLLIRVNSRVLIPRPESERLVDVALRLLQSLAAPTMIDIGTGSGCLALALAKNCPGLSGVAVDVSAEALQVAADNAAELQVTALQFEVLDILTAVPEKRFDLLVSNPPYVTGDEFAALPLEISAYEPRLALTDGTDGLTFYRRYAELASRIVNPGGWLVLETGRGEHPRQARGVFTAAGFTDSELIRDFNGDERVLKVRVP